MKKHGIFLIMSASLLGLAACGGGTDSGSSAATSASQSSAPASESSASASASDTTASSDSSTSKEPEVQLANGAYNFKYLDGEERTKILGKLEKYAVDNKLTGLTLFGNGGYVLYRDDVVKGSSTYIPGYGFGVLAEGNITADLPGETNANWKRYLHTWNDSDSKTINMMNSQGSDVTDYVGYVNDSYFGNYMNETKDGYDWVGSLSPLNRPIPLNADANGFATKYRIEVKVGSAKKYATTSAKYAAFDGREVALEDYITPYKIYYTQAYQMTRGSENLDKEGSIAGAKAYYEATKTGYSAEAWENIGIKGVEDGGKSYLEFTLNFPATRFFAMYYLSSSMFAPVPEDFIKAIGDGDFATGVANWGNFTETESIVDHWLCTGPYMLERWDADQQVVFKKNPYFDDKNGTHYKIPGIHFNILSAYNTDKEAALKEFNADKLHSCGIPSTQLEKYKNDPRATMTSDSSTFKLNLNTCTQDVWNELFGVNGTVKQTSVEDYYKCKPIMANKDFVSGLSFALDRKTFAETLGRTPSSNYFASAYMSDPEGGIAYNNTPEHAEAVKDMVAGTDGYGYSLEKARASFRKACDTLIAEGAYKSGETVKLEMSWMYPSDETEMHALFAGMIEKAFNEADLPLKLELDFWADSQSYMGVYNRMMSGQFDIGFGSISGNPLDPLNFLEVLKSDNSSGYTLNWGLDTNANDPDHLIEYDGKYWSFDALWTVADHGGYVEDGKNSPLYAFDPNPVLTAKASGDVTVEGKVKLVELLDDAGETIAASDLASVVLYGYNAGGADYYEVELDFQIADLEGDPNYNYSFVATIPANAVSYFNDYEAALGLDFYFNTELLGNAGVVYAGSAEIEVGGLPVVG